MNSPSGNALKTLGSAFLPLVALMGTALTQGCKTQPIGPTMSERIEQEERVEAAISEAVEGMLDELKQLHAGRYPELRVAFLAETTQPECVMLNDAPGRGMVFGEEKLEGCFVIPQYFREVRRSVERRVKKETENALLIYDNEIFGSMLREIGIADRPLDVVLTEYRDALRTVSEAQGREPIDAICRILVTGSQVERGGGKSRDDSYYVRWDIEVRMVDARPVPTTSAEGFAKVTCREEADFENSPSPWIDIDGINSLVGGGNRPAGRTRTASAPLPSLSGAFEDLGESISGGLEGLDLPTIPLDIEPNDSAASAQPLAPGAAAGGLIGGPQDTVDYYVVQVPSSGQLSARLTNVNAVGSKGAVGTVRIESATGQRLTATGGTLRKGGAQKTSTSIPVQAGTQYLVCVTSADKNLPIPYRVEILFE